MKRRDILKRDSCTCQRCGLRPPYGRNLVVHKIDPSGDIFNPGNLILLCKPCSELVTRRGYKTRKQIIELDPELDGITIGDKRYSVVVVGIDNGWQAFVYGSRKRKR